MKKTVGLVGGSFDPITKGHEFLIDEAARIFNELHVVIGRNPSKKYSFSNEKRLAMVNHVLHGIRARHECDIHTHFIDNDLLVNFAAGLGVTHLVRGIRFVKDLEDEMQIAQVNRRINPNINTIYIFPPPELSEVSSSIVRGLVGYNGWESAVARYIDPFVIECFKEALMEKKA